MREEKGREKKKKERKDNEKEEEEKMTNIRRYIIDVPLERHDYYDETF